MQELTREEILHNLQRRTIDDHSFERIHRFYPIAKVCPTCDGLGKYNLDFQTFECDCELQKILQKHYFMANIGRRYHDIGLKDFEGPDRDAVVKPAQDYIDKFDHNFHYGIGLTFSGTLGTGKTFAASCVGKELIKRGKDVYFISFEDLITTWSNSWKDDDAKGRLDNRLKTTHVLILDELQGGSTEKQEMFLASGLESIIRHRTSNLLPTIITTNLRPSDELDQFGKTYSLLSATNVRIITNGHDRRMREVRERNFELKQRGERRPIC